MKTNELGNKWNPYIKSVPKSKKLKLKMKGFDDMANEKPILSLKRGTASNDILYILKEYGSYPERKLKELIPDKQPSTIYKVSMRLEDEGYTVRKKGIDGNIIVSLSRLGQDIMNTTQKQTSSTPKKVTRQGNLSVVSMMFDKSIPFGNKEEVQRSTYLHMKNDIIEMYPGCEKVISTSRFAGIYCHYGEYMAVFKLGSSMYWVDNAERQVKEYLENHVYKAPITKAIFFIEDYAEAEKFLRQGEEDKRNYGKALRESLELSSCYRKVFLFTDDNTGVAQLRLFRSYQMIEELFQEAVFAEDEKSPEKESIVDGYIDGVKCIVLFNGDIINIKLIRRMLDYGMLDKVNIICYDFQEDFLRTAFAPWDNRVIYNSYSIAELEEVLGS